MRISSSFIGRSLGCALRPCDGSPAATEWPLTIVPWPTTRSPSSRQATCPGRRRRPARRGRRSPRPDPVQLEAALPPRRVVAEPDTVDPLGSRCSVAPRIRTRRVASSMRGPAMTLLVVGVGRQDVEGLAAPYPEAAPLSHGEVVVAVVSIRGGGRERSTTSPGRSSSPRVAAKELPLALAGQEAEVLALGAARHLEVRPRRRSRGPPAWSARRAGNAGARATPGRSPESM